LEDAGWGGADTLAQGLGALDQVQQIAIGVFEEDETVAFVRVWLSCEFDALFLQLFVTGVEVLNGDRDVPDTRAPHLGVFPDAVGRNNLDQTAVLGLNKVVAGIFKRYLEFESLDVPLGQAPGIWGCDCEMLDSGEHQSRILAMAGHIFSD
jgi:hypothetical protein